MPTTRFVRRVASDAHFQMNGSSRYELLRVVGRGAFGTVVMARDRFTRRRVAIKRILVNNDGKLQLVRELSALRCLQHVNVLRFIDSYGQGELVAIVTEHVPFNLQDFIKDPRRPHSENLLRFFYAQIVQGLAYIHSMGIMHRDMKPDNILLTRENCVKIADFGQCCLYVQNADYDINVSTRWYRAPELLFGYRNYDASIDVWSSGCILAEMIRGRPLFAGRSELEQISVIFSILGTPNAQSWPEWQQMPDANKLYFEPREPIDNWMEILNHRETSGDLLELLLMHLKLCASHRARCSELLKHRWLQPTARINYNCRKLDQFLPHF